MADAPELKLHFRGSCPDCGIREVHLPPVLPDVGDDFDWRVRDYNGFRMFMLEELAARFPERKRWNPADLEVVLIEILATILDQLSDMMDRVAAEAYLETARRPETVRQLLNFIGYDAVAIAQSKKQINGTETDENSIKELEDYWRNNPYAMEQARRAGPREIHTQKRMVTVEDYATRLQEHPLVLHAHAWKEWSGSWYTLNLAVIILDNKDLDESTTYPNDIQEQILAFHKRVDVRTPVIPLPSGREILKPYIESFRMIGQEVVLQEPVYVGVYMSISIRLASNFYQSEMRHAIAEVLGHGPGGFFEPGKLGFGEDLYASDVIEALMSVDGIENVCLNRFKRIGNQYLDNTTQGYIPMDGLEVAVCNNDPGDPAMGYYRYQLQGGRKG